MHKALPQKMTIEKLAQWITENQIDKRIHIIEKPLTEQQIHDFEKKITLATTKIYELQDLEKQIKATIKLGTQFIDEKYMPQPYEIPGTKGTKALEENRKYYTEILEKGHLEENVDLYGIPYPEEDCVVFFDIEGKEFDQYTVPMTEEQSLNFGRLFVDPKGGLKKESRKPEDEDEEDDLLNP